MTLEPRFRFCLFALAVISLHACSGATVTPDAMTPDAVLPDLVAPTPDAMTPDAVLPDLVAPADTPDSPSMDDAEGSPCSFGQVSCGGICVGLDSDVHNCGACGHACATSESCVAGACACAAGRLSCGGSCVDPQSDSANCGACGITCGASTTCVAGVCTCPAPYRSCGGSCVDTSVDSSHCGRCDNPCVGGTHCDGGSCVCAPDRMLCLGVCLDVSSDPMNCAICGRACPPGVGCTGGMCDCPSGQVRCGYDCVTLSTDARNCGTCGNVCAARATCVAGSCACASGETLCGSACSDLITDRLNCGTCGHACEAGQACVASVCQLAADVTILLDTTGSNATGIANAVNVLPTGLVEHLLAIPGFQVGVSYTAEFPTIPYGGTGDRPFTGVVEPVTDFPRVYAAFTAARATGGGDTPDAMIEGMAALTDLPLHPSSTALSCSPGREFGGCWRPGAKHIVVLVTDDIFHNGPDPSVPGALYSPYAAISPTPTDWPTLLSAMRSHPMTLLIINSSSLGAGSPAVPQYLRMLADLGQPSSDVFLGSSYAQMQTAAVAVLARIRVVSGL